MSEKHMLEEISKEVIKCSRCGNCRSICPVFLEENNENTTPRSKARMMEAVREGELELTPAMQERFDKCLLCKACTVNCGSGVRTDTLILEARAVLAEKHGIPLLKKMAFSGLRYRILFDLFLRSGSLFQGLVFKKMRNGRGRMARFPLPGAGLSVRRVIPNLSSRPLRSRVDSVIKAKTPTSKGRVVFFTGCTLNYIYPSAGEAVVNILIHNGWDVVIPDRQCCCGTPALVTGDLDSARLLAQHNVKVLTQAGGDHIITACGTCGAALQQEYAMLLEGDSSLEQWRKISKKVLDISQFVVEHCDLSQLGNLPFKVTYHDPCHLVRGMNVSAEPRKILQTIPGMQYVEMKHADRCCGAGGSFSASYYELSRKINDKKIDHAEATGMEYLVTGCSSCRMHITDGLSQRSSTMKVLHTAEVIDMAYAAGRKERGTC